MATSPRSYHGHRATRVSTRNGGLVVDTQGSIALPLCVMEGRPRTWNSPGRRVVWPPRVEDTSHASTLRAGTDRLARAGARDHGVSQRPVPLMSDDECPRACCVGISRRSSGYTRHLGHGRRQGNASGAQAAFGRAVGSWDTQESNLATYNY